jgi:hypothetical protein
MGILKRTRTYPDGRVVVEIIDMSEEKAVKRKESKTDGSKDKPKKAREPVSKAYTTSSSS